MSRNTDIARIIITVLILCTGWTGLSGQGLIENIMMDTASVSPDPYENRLPFGRTDGYFETKSVDEAKDILGISTEGDTTTSCDTTYVSCDTTLTNCSDTTLTNCDTVLQNCTDTTLTYGSTFDSLYASGRKVKITIDETYIDSDLTSWEAKIQEDELPDEMFDSDGTYPARSDGADVRFTSDAAGTSELARHIRHFNIDANPANGTADIVVNIGSVTSSAPTEIWVWYHDPDRTEPVASSTYGAENAYNASTELSYSFNESSGNAIDGTANTHDGTLFNTPTQGATGIIHNAYSFNASNNEYVSPQETVTPVGSYSYGGWIKTSGTGSNMALMDERDVGFDGTWARVNSDGTLRADVSADGGTKLIVNGAVDVTDNAWHYWYVTWDGTTLSIYVDGVLDNSGSDATVSNDLTDIFSIARRSGGATGGVQPVDNGRQLSYDGDMDDQSVQAGARSADEVKADYHSIQTSAFYTVGTPQSPDAPDSTFIGCDTVLQNCDSTFVGCDTTLSNCTIDTIICDTTITEGTGSGSIIIEDAGSTLGQLDSLDFAGDVTVNYTAANNHATVTGSDDQGFDTAQIVDDKIQLSLERNDALHELDLSPYLDNTVEHKIDVSYDTGGGKSTTTDIESIYFRNGLEVTNNFPEIQVDVDTASNLFEDFFKEDEWLGGDLTKTPLDAEVVGIQGIAISGTVTNDDYVLKHDSINGILYWAPDLGGGSGGDDWGNQVVETTAELSGDGTAGNTLGIAQQGATSGQHLEWTGSAWAPATPDYFTGTDISGTESAFDGWDKDASDDVSALDDLNDVANSTPSDGDVIIYDGVTDNRYENRALSEADIPDLDHYTDADIDGTESAFDGWDKNASDDVVNVNDLGDVSAGSPSDGNILKYNSTSGEWELGSDAGSGTADLTDLKNNGTLVVTDASDIDFGQEIDLTDDGDNTGTARLAQQGASDGQVLAWNNTNSAWEPTTTTGDAWGSQVVETSSELEGDGTSGSPLGIAQQAAGSGDHLEWTGSAWAPATPDYFTGSDISGTESAFDGWDKDESDDVVNLHGLNDVSNLSPVTGDVLVYDGVDDQYENRALSESDIEDLDHFAGSDITGNETAFDGWDKNASDDFTGSDITGNESAFDGWDKNASDDVANLNDLGDVSAGTPSSGENLQWNGSAWVPVASASTPWETGTGVVYEDDDNVVIGATTTSNLFEVSGVAEFASGGDITFHDYDAARNDAHDEPNSSRLYTNSSGDLFRSWHPSMRIREVSQTSFTPAIDDGMIWVTGGGSTVTVNLPSGSAYDEKIYYVGVFADVGVTTVNIKNASGTTIQSLSGSQTAMMQYRYANAGDESWYINFVGSNGH